jgi:hypothetical protein
MKRRFHWSLPVGFLLALAGIFTVPFFAGFAATRDFAWLNLLLLFCGLVFLVVAVTRSFREPQLFRGKILGSILATLSLLTLAFFTLGIFHFGRVPQPATLHSTGEKAADFSLPDQDGKTVSLADLLASPQTKGALLIFYRGHW